MNCNYLMHVFTLLQTIKDFEARVKDIEKFQEKVIITCTIVIIFMQVKENEGKLSSHEEDTSHLRDQ